MIGTLLILSVLTAVAGADNPVRPADVTSADYDKLPIITGPMLQANLLDGKTEVGQLADIFADQILLKAKDSSFRKIPFENLLSISPQKIAEPSRANPTVWIELVDGSKFNSTSFTMKNGTAKFKLGDKAWQASSDAISIVRFSKPGDPASAPWPAKVGAEASTDLLAIRKKDAVDFDEGVIESVDDNHVIFQLDGESVPVSRSKVDGLILFHKASDAAAEPACIVETFDGWRFKAKGISLAKDRIEITTSTGPMFAVAIENLNRIDFSIGKVTYLSDLEPISVRWTPYLDFHKASAAMEQYYAPRHDEGRDHQPLMVGGKTYPKGLSIYSRTEMVYRLPAGTKRFKAIAGIDESAREVGGVRLEISADGKTLLNKPIVGSDGAVDIDLDVSGAKRLTILVDYGAGLDAGDYLNLADARVMK